MELVIIVDAAAGIVDEEEWGAGGIAFLEEEGVVHCLGNDR